MLLLAAAPQNQAKIETTKRAINDPALRQGDTAATGKDLVVFVGRDEMKSICLGT